MGSPKDHAKEVVGSAHVTGRFVSPRSTQRTQRSF